MRRLSMFGILAAAWLAFPAYAAVTAPPDPRVHMVAYDPNRLVSLHGELGFQMVLVFAPEEHIDNVSIGDALAWQITPNKRANLLFLKPLDAGVVTNMTVVSDQRRYIFELDASKAKPGHSTARTYVVQFTYPQNATSAAAETRPASIQRTNTKFAYLGGKALLPAEVFDDGRFTYFQWPEQTAVPAIFTVSEKGEEGLVNFGVRDGYVVVEQLAPRFVLRNGKEVTTIVNQAWHAPAPGPDAPPPVSQTKAGGSDADPR